MKLSILTSTYNRGNLLNRLYESINKNLINECIDVQWLVMDDGSTDNTTEIINKIKENANFEILYFKQENKGKMEAINNLMSYANGELIVECDSDDYFTDNSFVKINNDYTKINDDIYALCYLKYNQNRCNIGNLFKQEKTTMFDLYFKQGENGEKALVYNANIRKKYKYELENNEKFITEARLQHKMDKDYNIICVNEPIMICEYQQGGYTNNIDDMFAKYPYGYYEYFKEIFTMNMKGVNIKKRLYVIKHYILFGTLINKKLTQLLNESNGIFNKLLIFNLYLPGKTITKMRYKN